METYIIRGPLGVGKSTIAKMLAEKIDAKYISVDSVLDENNLTPKEGNITVDVFLEANNIIIQKMNDKVAVIDGNFYYQEQLDDLKSKLPKDTIVFTLKASLETCIQRDSARKKSYGEGATMAVYNLVNQFDAGVIVETEGKTEETVLEEIISKS